ncbi:DUF1559 family PulG-like putative transporter [Zavarzinella formosa]|uniref:DUF1559 family PulG-like putative transporter n=1 Tax=Zavarzinella formosa TaxID=360055 RepID=UPI0002D630B2|nr:DUF1559 domain-containing protein [Zavarzinella formosa]
MRVIQSLQRRAGFARTDLTVAIGLVVLGTGLFLPKLQAKRTDAAKIQCQENLRKIGQASLEFEKAQGGFPPRRAGFNDGSGYGGWGSYLLPHLGETELAKKYNLKLDFFDPGNKVVSETQLKTFLCPAAPTKRSIMIQAQSSAKTDNPDKDSVWTINAGVSDYITSNGILAPRTGYGMNANATDQMLGNQRQAMADNVFTPISKITDGLSCTILVIEQAGRPEVWRAGKKQEVNNQFGAAANARGTWAGWGSIAFGPSGPDGIAPAKGDVTDCSVNCNNWFGIYGFHEAGANILLCDGSVRFVGKKLDPLTFIYLTLRDDGHLLSPTDY